MTVTRRSFLVNTAYAGAAVLVTRAAKPTMLAAEETDPGLAPYLSGMRMAATPATNYRAYRSKKVTDPEITTWIQVDLKNSVAIERVLLYPACEKGYPGRDGYYGGEGFPLRFKIEASDDEGFAQAQMIADFTRTDFPDPADHITQYAGRAVRGRYVRLTATRLRPVKMEAGGGITESKEFTLTMAKIGVLAGGKDIAVDCAARVDPEHGDADEAQQVTRPARQDGEDIRMDHPHLVTDAATWERPALAAQVPRSGVTLQGGVFQKAMENNIEYLLNSYTTDELLRQFYERTGKVKNFKPEGTQKFWEEDLAGSNAGRFLMGAGNTVRWIDHPELKRRLTVVVDGIEECRQPNGYIMAYPEDTIFYSERAAYTRAWLTHGLLEAAYAGNSKALPMLRGYYDWFNRQPFLPLMLRGAVQGGQGMIANSRVCLSPAGKPEDVQILQRYYQEDSWLNGLARREKDQVWQYPYDRPHCYLLTNLEAYMDMYLATGDKRYYDAVLGAWELYRAHWQQAGGSISIIEFMKDPPDSNYLRQELGELCGSSFWVFLSQRFQMLHPDDERFAAEIEKSIYNVGIANQDGGDGLRYHTNLEGRKEKSTHYNSCCEGQGTRLLGSLPEHIFSVAPDGIYVNLYEPSTIRWERNGQPMTFALETRFPFDDDVRARVQSGSTMPAKIRIRVPGWATGPMEISVNGKRVGSGDPGTYFPVKRTWATGDTIEFRLPTGFRMRRYNGEDQIQGKERYSIEYGPILMAAVGSSKVDLTLGKEQSLSDQLEKLPGSPLHFAVGGKAGQKLMPYWQVSKEEFTCYPSINRQA